MRTTEDKIKDVLIFSHEQDVDGLLSAAVLRIKYPNSEIVLTNYGFDNMVTIKDKIVFFTEQCDQLRRQQQSDGSIAKEERRERIIIIADIGVNEDSHGPVYEALEISRQRGFFNIWIDHHPWPEDMKEKFSNVCELVLPLPGVTRGKKEITEGHKITQDDKQIGFEDISTEKASNNKMCTTELCIERFALSNNPDAKILGAIAHRTDFPDSTRFPIPPLTSLISYYLGSKELSQKLYSVILDSISQGILWNIPMQKDMIEAARLIDESIAKSIENMIIREFLFTIISHKDGVGKTNDSSSPSSSAALSPQQASAVPEVRPKPSSVLRTQSERRVRVAIAKADSFVSRSILLGRIMDMMNDNILRGNIAENKDPISQSNTASDTPAVAIDLAISYTDDGKLSIRRANRQTPSENAFAFPSELLDCGKIAATFREGGGHPGAAGGFLKTNVKEKGDHAVIIEIESTLQNYFEQLEAQQQRK